MSGINIIDKAKESHQTMTHTMFEIPSLTSFSFKSRGFRERKALVNDASVAVFFSVQIHRCGYLTVYKVRERNVL